VAVTVQNDQRPSSAAGQPAESLWGREVAGAPPAATFANAMLAFHAGLSANGGGAFGEFHQFFGPDVDCERKKVAAAWACFAEAIDEEARQHVSQPSFELLL